VCVWVGGVGGGLHARRLSVARRLCMVVKRTCDGEGDEQVMVRNELKT